ncbi:putative MetA-pathway of phenol degradation [compost metagenome]
MGGRLGGYAIGILPSVHLNAGGGSFRETGIGDTILGPVLAWGDGAIRTALALDISFPTGSFNKNSALNLGANYYSFRPILAVTYFPTANVEASAKITYTFNTVNHDTDYRSGQIFHFDYSLSYAITSSFRLGVNGYYIKQTTDDRQAGLSVAPDGFRGQAFAIGPAVHYQWQKVGLELRVLKEYGVRNRPASQQLWAKAVIPL